MATKCFDIDEDDETGETTDWVAYNKPPTVLYNISNDHITFQNANWNTEEIYNLEITEECKYNSLIFNCSTTLKPINEYTGETTGFELIKSCEVYKRQLKEGIKRQIPYMKQVAQIFIKNADTEKNNTDVRTITTPIKQIKEISNITNINIYINTTELNIHTSTTKPHTNTTVESIINATNNTIKLENTFAKSEMSNNNITNKNNVTKCIENLVQKQNNFKNDYFICITLGIFLMITILSIVYVFCKYKCIERYRYKYVMNQIDLRRTNLKELEL